MDGWTRPTWVPLSLFLSRSRSSSSITQPQHEYKWRPVKSRDRVPVNGFLLGLRQQCSPNGFSLTGFNHVPWYPLKRMQIVNQTSSPPSAAVFASFPVIILPSFTLLLLPISSSYSLHILARPPCFRVRFVSICPEDIDMSRIQVGWNNERGEGHAHAKFKENTAFLQSTCWHFE